VTNDAVQPVNASYRARLPTLAAALGAGQLPADGDTDAPLPLDSIGFLPPIPRPERIFCIGMNYAEHIREMGREPPEYPAMFIRFPDSLVGHGEALVRPRVSREYDFEGELAVIIGRAARHVAREQALDHVAGYTILMDGSVRDYQRHTTQYTAGKNFTASGAMGPWLVTADEIPDPRRLSLETWVSGEKMQAGELSDLCIDVPAVISYLSQICELKPGDVISTGTPSGVGYARDPQRWLVPGDTVEVRISGIGSLVNPVVEESA
jgi:2-keto-4-pentenoate hydratase/2-oxohepta-3-ene-1,7-dioic acid hydratase in catechol pathway